MSIRKVHVVFKTHLDIGFTDFSANVVDHYLYSFIPAAIRLAKETNAPGKPKRFVWTVGSYILDLALRTLKGDALQQLDGAIRAKDIAYHALPFTTHSELCGQELFEAGIRIAGRLDARYGRKTIAAKMTDVPGHTVGIVAPLLDAGVAFLHIGVNGAAHMPQVPPLFMWENPQGRRIMTAYSRSYGGLTWPEGHDEALYLLHSDDNAGPPKAERLMEAHKELEARFPGAEVAASTLDAFAESLRPLENSLPVIRGEIGDTWIHGVGSDPKKTAQLRAMERLARKWDREEAWQCAPGPMPDGRPIRDAFLEGLLLVCEHTWGLDQKKFLSDFTSWRRKDFDRARAKDVIPADSYIGTPYESTGRFAKVEFERVRPKDITWETRSFSLFERSHQEQRDYIATAVSLLPRMLHDEAEMALARLEEGIKPPGRAGRKAPVGASPLSPFRAEFREGELLLKAPSGAQLRMGMPFYQETGFQSYDRLFNHYMYDFSKNRDWAIADYGKPGAEDSDAPRDSVNHVPEISRITLDDKALQIEGPFETAPQLSAGCPAGFRMRLCPISKGLEVRLHLYGKPANRKPEALFIKFSMEDAAEIRLRKIGQWINPAVHAENGNLRVHGMDGLLWTDKDGREIQISSLDSPLAALGQPDLLEFGGDIDYGTAFFNLYNNLWGTNFKMWYGEDILCRFVIEISAE
ncbi:MAG: DUF5054 domain-containing protein [Eubacteriales bacterium]|nr:DUF5054 domain-containing protein [Eubacteriales bacterium]